MESEEKEDVMQKRIIIIGIVAGLVLMFSHCERISHPLENDPAQQDETEIALGKRPPKVKAKIESLEIDGIPLILNDEVQIADPKNPDTHPVVHLADGAQIHYRVTSSEDIYWVRLELRYDANANSETFNHAEGDDCWLETGSQILQTIYDGSDDKLAEVTVVWNGSVKPLGMLDGPLYQHQNYQLFDQLATYDYRTKSPFPHGMDHYMLRIDVYAENCVQLKSEIVYFWIDGTVDRSSNRLIVRGIEFDSRPERNKTIPIARVQIVQTSGSPISGAYIYGRWLGLFDETTNGGPSDADGWITIEGQPLRNRQSGSISFTVSTVHTRTGVYDPWSNPFWTWPFERPKGETVFPQ